MRLCATRAGFTVSGNNVLRIWKTVVADLVFLLKCRDINIHDGFTVNFLERSVVEQSNRNKVLRDVFVEMLIVFQFTYIK